MRPRAAAHEGPDERGQGQESGSCAKACSPNTSSRWSASSCSCWPSTARWKPGSPIAASRRSLADGMSEKAEATAKRIEQSMSDLERQISWVTRASSDHASSSAAPTTRNCCGRCRRSASSRCSTPRAASNSAITRQTVTLGSNADFSRDVRLHRDHRARHQLCAGLFPRTSGRSCRSRCRMPTAASPSPRSTSTSSSDFLDDAQVGKVAFAYVIDPKGEVLASSAKGPEVGKNLSALPQVAAVMHDRRHGADVGHRYQRRCGADHGEPGAEARLARVLRTADRAGADADPRPAGADRASDRARPRGRDHRRHHHGAPHAGADHGAAGRRAASRRRRFRPPHRGEDRRTSWKSSPTSSTAWRASSPRPIPASKTR